MDAINTLKKIVKTRSMADVNFDNGTSFPVDLTTANALLKAYNQLGTQEKKKFERMLNKGPKNFMALVDFAFG